MLSLIQLIAVLSTTIFAGAAIYINLVEHPARMGCSTELTGIDLSRCPACKKGTMVIVAELPKSSPWDSS